MRRRDFLTLTAGGLVSNLCFHRALGATRSDRPNILWLTCEDISPNLGCYGDDYAITPSLDRFAAQGVRFTQACGITGVCAVNRSSLITGMYSSSIGSHDMRSRTRLPDSIKCFSEYLRAAGYYCTNNSKTDYNFPTPRTAWHECSNEAHWRKRKPGQPFFAVFNYTGTHESQYRLSPERWKKRVARLTPKQRHDATKAPVPPFHPDTPKVRRDWANYYDTITALDYWIADRLKELEDGGPANNTIVFFFSDHGVGLPGCKKWVWDWGLRVPLIIRTPEKCRHLELAPSGSVSDRLVSFVDFAPTVLSLAGVSIPPHIQGDPFLGKQSTPPREVVYAIRDRMAERYDTVRVVRDSKYQYHRNFMPHLPWSQYVSYTEQMPTMQVWRNLHEQGKLNQVQDRYFQPKEMEELYDVEADPHMSRNLAGNSKYSKVIARMRKRLRVWQLSTRDLGVLPEYEVHSRSAGSTPYELAHDDEHFPLERILDAAELASQRDVKAVPQLQALLKDEDSAVRWWAATGLVALGQKALPAKSALLATLKDASAIVRIAGADALCNLDLTETAMPILLDALKHETPFLRLRAMTVLDRIGNDAKPTADAMRKAKMKKKGAIFPADYLNHMIGYVTAKWADV
jgi:uncharacterized sulfatase